MERFCKKREANERRGVGRQQKSINIRRFGFRVYFIFDFRIGLPHDVDASLVIISGNLLKKVLSVVSALVRESDESKERQKGVKTAENKKKTPRRVKKKEKHFPAKRNSAWAKSDIFI